MTKLINKSRLIQRRWTNVLRSSWRVALSVAIPLGVSACNVDSQGQPSGGLGVEPRDGGTDPALGGDAGQTPAPQAGSELRGFAIVNSDFTSASVSLVDPDGSVLSRSFIASSSAAPGLSAALGGDVALPTTQAAGAELTIIDRGSAVLTWINLASGDVRAQLNVGTGFASNPQDYVAVGADKAFVTRHDPNLANGEEPFDLGSDVLIIDPRVPEITGSIDLSVILQDEPEGFFPRPARALMAGGLLRVLALGFNEDFSDRVDSRIVSIDPVTNEIAHVLVLDGLTSCGSLALSPDGTELAVGCNGAFGQDPEDGFPDSGIVTLAVGTELEERERYAAADLGGEVVSGVSYAAEGVVAFTTNGRFNQDFSGQIAADTARTLDLETGDPSASLRESATFPFSLQELRCSPTAAVCLLTDAETEGGVVHRFEIDDSGALVNRTEFVTDAAVGLPPTGIGLY